MSQKSSITNEHVDYYKSDCENLMRNLGRSDLLNKPREFTSSLIFDPVKYNMDLPCKGKYLRCKNDEITEQDLALLVPNVIQDKKTSEKIEPIKTIEVPEERQTKQTSKFLYRPPQPKATETKSNQIGAETNLLKDYYKESVSRKYTNSNPQPIKSSKNAINYFTENEPQPSTSAGPSNFKTGREELIAQHMKKYGYSNDNAEAGPSTSVQPQTGRKSLGIRRNVRSKFIPPLLTPPEEQKRQYK